jgi:uncharacterized protein (UPF0147 family)
MSNEITTTEERITPTQWLDSDPEALAQALEVRKTNRALLINWIRSALVEGTDFGRIHVVKRDKCPEGARCQNPYHFSKPSLWKGGAEKITGMLGLTVRWPNLEEELASVKNGCEVIILKCELLNQVGHTASVGVGARNVRQDASDINKSLKMAKKSAMIDAVLTASGLSEVFTQDISDDDSIPDEVRDQLDESQQAELLAVATELFGDQGQQVLESLARHRFRFSDGDWKRIPAFRMVDAIRSLREKAESDWEQQNAS